MNSISENKIICPYCGKAILVLIDCSLPEQEYIEDCQVCCRPILFKIVVPLEGVPLITVFHENE